ncbi:hypothetical protein [Pseudomonas saponiphila]|uniref:hypothetical protein n=1 Tax=Pseudomonas saponiphila TaxID=556534 RepID=UPI00223FAEAA|nr:hypothetical protein [Pseudomonas saponiphila]
MSATFAKLASIIFPAWIAKLLKEAPAMSDMPVEPQATAAPAPAVVAEAAPAVGAIAPYSFVPDAPASAQAPDLIAKLEAILAALGHELPVFWGEAVALAKKAL